MVRSIIYPASILFILLLTLISGCRKATVEIVQFPENTPKGARIYIAGNFNNWNPADPNYMLKWNEELNRFQVELPRGLGKIEYKFTRGDWTTVETDSCGGQISNRVLQYDKDLLIFTDKISSWNDLDPLNCPRVTLLIDRLPNITPGYATIFLSGTINNWEEAMEAYRFKRDALNRYYLTLPRKDSKLYFKLNRGNWATVETDKDGKPVEQHVVEFGREDTVRINVEGWLDLPQSEFRNITIRIERLPEGTNKNSPLFLAGDFNEWNPVDPNYIFRNTPDGKKCITISVKRNQPHEFKITRGAWERAEGDILYNETPNRVIPAQSKDTLLAYIPTWVDQAYERLMPRKPDVPIIVQRPEHPLKPAAPILAEKEKIQSIRTYSRKIFFIIDKLPPYTKPDQKIFLAGDFNNWDGANPYYQFRSLPGNKRFYVLRLQDYDAHEFKITRGGWDQEEATQEMERPGNRKIQHGTETDTIHLTIEQWIDYTPNRKVTIILSSVPPETGTAEPIYLVGDFNNWNPKDERYRFQLLSDGRRVLQIQEFDRTYNFYKITRGDWGTEFANRKGNKYPNLRLTGFVNDTLYLKIPNWIDRKR